MNQNLSRFDLNVGGIAISAFADPNSPEQWVAVRPICEVLGIDPKRQCQKLQNNPQFSWGHMSSTGNDGKLYDMLCIPVDELGMWLCGINANRTKPDVREKLITFQKKMQIVIYNAITSTVNDDTVKSLVMLVNSLQTEVRELKQRAAKKDSLEASFAARRMANRRWDGDATMLC